MSGEFFRLASWLRGLPADISGILAILVIAAPVEAAPAVGGMNGVMDHGATVTIIGSGFGSKAQAAPLVWDNGSGDKILNIWSGAWPNLLPGYNTGYYSSMRGIDLPHAHATRYIAGAHAANTGAYSGYNVTVFKAVSFVSFPAYVYASWYQRSDDNWVFGQDNNYKVFDYSEGKEPYTAWKNWPICYGPPHPGSTKDGAQWTIEPGAPIKNPDLKGHNSWWASAVNPMAGKWSKVEIAFKVTDQADGYVDVWENGRKVISYVGPTDNYAGTQRTIGIGGFARMKSPNNWRYFDDIYVDTSLARVVLADKPVLSQATIIENQIPTAWSDRSITATVNLGRFNQGQAAYLIVVDDSGTPSASGLQVTAGSRGSTAAGPTSPNPPSSVEVH